eukprot:6070130-Prymnesium_polylepis.2
MCGAHFEDTFQDVGLLPFHIELEEIDASHPLLLQQLGERQRPHSGVPDQLLAKTTESELLQQLRVGLKDRAAALEPRGQAMPLHVLIADVIEVDRAQVVPLHNRGIHLRHTGR